MKEYLVVGYAVAVTLQLPMLVPDPPDLALRVAVALASATIGAWAVSRILPDWR